MSTETGLASHAKKKTLSICMHACGTCIQFRGQAFTQLALHWAYNMDLVCTVDTLALHWRRPTLIVSSTNFVSTLFSFHIDLDAYISDPSPSIHLQLFLHMVIFKFHWRFGVIALLLTHILITEKLMINRLICRLLLTVFWAVRCESVDRSLPTIMLVRAYVRCVPIRASTRLQRQASNHAGACVPT